MAVLKTEMWLLGRNLSDELYRTELGHVWLDGDWSNLKNICQITKNKCNDMQKSRTDKVKEPRL